MKIKKVVCFLFGHKIVEESCPVTGAKKTYCKRCLPIIHSFRSTFS
jgi:hypothetical protein